MPSKLPAILMLMGLACAGAASDDLPPETSVPVVTDAGAAADADGQADAGMARPLTTCCRLDNERGERLDYLCSEQLDVPELEGEGYRCWLVR